jgi:tRNA-dihydrouridine synthase
MAEPALVADGVKAMQRRGDLPVTVKHRIGIDRIESYDFVRDFVGTVAGAAAARCSSCTRAMPGCRACRPKENREIPPLRYELVHRLKRDFPQLTIAINGGITTSDEIAEQLQHVDGVMVGREAYHNPWLMADWDARFLGRPAGAARPPGRGDGDGRLHAAPAGRRRALVAHGPPHAGPVARHSRGPPLAPGVVRPPAEGPAAAGGAAGPCAHRCATRPTPASA